MSLPGPDEHRPDGIKDPPSRWNPAVTALMILLGLPLLLPGVCSYLFSRGGVYLNPLAAAGFLASFGGLAMIGFGIRRLFVRPFGVPAISERAKLTMLLIYLALLVLPVLATLIMLRR